MPTSSVLLPSSRIRNASASKSATLTPAQRTARAKRNSQLQNEINDAIDEWTKSTLNTASELARRFNKKERYFLDIFFQGGAHLIHKQTKVNAYNAFKHLKAEELRDDGERPTLSKLNSEEFKAEYEALDDAELEELVANHSEQVSSGTFRKRNSAQARVQDVSSTIRTMQKLMTGLNMRVGIEGFFCIVRNTPDYHMEPKWYFSSEALKDYMKIAVPIHKGWDISHVGAKLEAFAVAGCDPVNLYRTSKQKADHMKRQIREKIVGMLAEITGNANAAMHYADYEEKVVQQHGVELIGWTYEKLVNPSELSTSLPGLRQLLEAINTGSCKFIKLTQAQLKQRREEHQKAIEDGSLPAPKTRKPRRDKGTKRKRTADDKENGNENGNDRTQPASKKSRRSTAKKGTQGADPKSKEIVDSESESD